MEMEFEVLHKANHKTGVASRPITVAPVDRSHLCFAVYAPLEQRAQSEAQLDWVIETSEDGGQTWTVLKRGQWRNGLFADNAGRILHTQRVLRINNVYVVGKMTRMVVDPKADFYFGLVAALEE